jgi:FkbM family methyltransferase
MERLYSAPAFVISLPRSAERYTYALTNIKNAGFKDIRLSVGVDSLYSSELIKGLNIFNNPPIDWEVSDGQIGCLLSHLMVLRNIIDNKILLATIFEDDVFFHPQWNELSEHYLKHTPNNYDLLYIGNGLDSSRYDTNSASVKEVTTESAWCTHAYTVTLSGAQKVFDSLINWDYKNFLHGSRGKTLTGLYHIDIMLKDTQNRILAGHIPRKYVWYSWNGTRYPCLNNKLPVTGNDARNTGLVFQDTDNLGSLTSFNAADYNHSFYDENDKIIDVDKHETTEQMIADKFISPNDIVLELGGRYGLVSYRINKKLNNTKNHFVVEPDKLIFNKLYTNLMRNGCNPHLFNGVVSKTDLFFQQAGIASRTREEPCSCEAYVVPRKSLQEIISETGLKFDTLVADCEGCLEKFIDENIDYLDNFKMITFEEDYHDYCNYEKIKQILKDHNFKCVRPGGHSVWTK